MFDFKEKIWYTECTLEFATPPDGAKKEGSFAYEKNKQKN